MVCIVINQDIQPLPASTERKLCVEYACFVNKLLPFFPAHRASISLSLNIYIKLCENKLHRKAVNATSCLINNMSAVLEPYINGENSSSSQLEFRNLCQW
jgi:hypothetical protein